jgi:hypothetical protein
VRANADALACWVFAVDEGAQPVHAEDLDRVVAELLLELVRAGEDTPRLGDDGMAARH